MAFVIMSRCPGDSPEDGRGNGLGMVQGIVLGIALWIAWAIGQWIAGEKGQGVPKIIQE